MSVSAPGSESGAASGPVRVHVVGRRNAGKTTLVCELVAELVRRRLKVATIKHTHHEHELDTPGKDSHRHRQAGAAGVGILSPALHALFVPVLPQELQSDPDSRYRRFTSAFSDCDLILVEGDLHTAAMRVEVWRSGLTEEPYACADSQIVALISDDDCPDICCPKIPRSSISRIADEFLRLCRPGAT